MRKKKPASAAGESKAMKSCRLYAGSFFMRRKETKRQKRQALAAGYVFSSVSDFAVLTPRQLPDGIVHPGYGVRKFSVLFLQLFDFLL